MKFPKGVRKARKPAFNGHGGRTWDFADVTLPDGTMINGRQDTTWSAYFYFEHAGVWFRAPWVDFEVRGSGLDLKYDLRDQKALAEVDKLIFTYESAIMHGTPDEIANLCRRVEEASVAAGYNNHARLAALHTMAEGLNK